jgi:hypothetical protein
MNEIDRENNEIEHLLRRAKLPEPPAELKERAIRAARKAWNEAAPDVPWHIPIRRLAISAAAAVLMISLANYCADRVAVAQQSHEFAVSTVETPELDDWLQMPRSRLVRHLGSKASVYSPATLRERMEKVRQMLDGSESTEPPDAGAPLEQRSRLLPARLTFYS